MDHGVICLECKKELFKKNGLIPIDDHYAKTLKYSDSIKSLLFEYPEIAKEWDFEKNYPLRPENIVSQSTNKIWWKCKKGHSWEATAISMVKGSNCPICKLKNRK